MILFNFPIYMYQWSWSFHLLKTVRNNVFASWNSPIKKDDHFRAVPFFFIPRVPLLQIDGIPLVLTKLPKSVCQICSPGAIWDSCKIDAAERWARALGQHGLWINGLILWILGQILDIKKGAPVICVPGWGYQVVRYLGTHTTGAPKKMLRAIP